MKRSKIMKTINKSIKNGRTVLNNEDLKELFDKFLMNQLLDVLAAMDCNVQVSGDNVSVTLTRTYDDLEIQVEEQIEEFEEF